MTSGLQSIGAWWILYGLYMWCDKHNKLKELVFGWLMLMLAAIIIITIMG